MSLQNQTISFLTRRFQQLGIWPATKHGQNFLIDNNLQRLLVESAQLTSRDVVLEVGTGTGALTAMIAEQAAAVVTVEIDQHLYDMAREELFDYPNVTILRLDALKNKNRLNAEMIDAVRDDRDAFFVYARVIEDVPLAAIADGDDMRQPADHPRQDLVLIKRPRRIVFPLDMELREIVNRADRRAGTKDRCAAVGRGQPQDVVSAATGESRQ